MDLTFVWAERLAWLMAGLLLEWQLHPIEGLMAWMEERWKLLSRYL